MKTTRTYKKRERVPTWLVWVVAIELGLVFLGMFLAPYLPEDLGGLAKPSKEEVEQVQAMHGLPQGGSEYMLWNM